MTQSVTIEAYAKINLSLAVGGKEPNGYHTVDTVMQAISLHDTVTVSRTETASPSFSLSCSETALSCDKTNLAWKAADSFFAVIGGENRFPVSVHIEKRIPIAGGLAGGSTDCAAVLIGLNALSGHPLSTDTLLSVGAKLGADVPFCILADSGIPTAYGTHYGEAVVPVATLPTQAVVIAVDGEPVSTPWAYGILDTLPPDTNDRITPVLQALNASDNDAVYRSLYNRFESAILPARPRAAYIKQMLSEHSAVAAMMSGSGSSVFGFFPSEKEAQCAAAFFSQRNIHAWVCKTLEKGYCLGEY